MLKERLQPDLKEAMLAGDKARTEVLRGLKSAITYEEVAKGAREAGLTDEAILVVFAREAKKRAESAQLYEQAGETTRAETELSEKKIIDGYLPTQLSDEELAQKVQAAISKLGDGAQFGQVIGIVKQEVGMAADGGRIAAAVKAALAK